MRHTTDYRRSSPTPGARSPRLEGGSPALYALLTVSAFLGFAIVPGGALLAGLMVLAACGWVLWVLVSATGSLIKFLVVATAGVIAKRQAQRSGRAADSGRRSSPSFSPNEPARSGV